MTNITPDSGAPDSSRPTIEAPKKKPTLAIVLGVLAVAVIGALIWFFVAQGNNGQSSPGNSTAPSASDGTAPSDDAEAGDDSGAITEGLGSPSDPVQFGTVGAGDPYWATFKAAVEAEGISIDIVDFSDYTAPNPALSEGELDINQFQHIIFLAQYNVASGADLVPTGSTAIYPLGLYSKQFDSVEEIPDGSTVAVPNDTTNLARALLLLQSQGLVTLQDGGSPFSGLNDVIQDESRVQVQALDAALTATSLEDVAAAVINNDFVGDAGLTAGDAIAEDDPSDPSAQPYINIFATSPENADNEVLQRIVEIYQTNQEVLDGVQETAGGTAQFVVTPVEELVESLKVTEEDYAANQ
ncbi:MetQ/NlpA family ABC transporter substrate-binding protein [Humidisolicoccus flavus]|uniref:MetQ/NlpA family ABC transporter substrate-binding protein n=1 Tax=Humidisolicoccus flavus TaxID=3111414 RepID=UPI003246B17F